MTALFCDLVGFTPLTERLDPEEVRDIQAEYFSAMSEQIERYGGIVEKYAGDAVLALFGAVQVHEDDAERAVLCALEMQGAIAPLAARARARWQMDPAIRVGVNTGEVVSGTWNASGPQDVAVTGDAVNVAARMQAAAETGEVLVGEATMRLTRRRIVYGPGRALSLKGKAALVPGYPAEGIRAQLGERWEEYERSTPLVGRERELQVLVDAWQRAQAGEGGIVSLMGEPGVGKSRLVAEVVTKLSDSAAIRVLRARCLSYGQAISLWLIADVLRSLFGINEQDGAEEIRARLLPLLGMLLAEADQTSRDEAADVLGEVLGLPPGGSLVSQAGPEIRRHALIRSLRLLLAALAARSPGLVVLEDLHWVDQASQEVLQEIMSDLPGLRLLVVVTQRPGWTATWSGWSWPERIALRPLPQHDAAVLAGAVLGGITLSSALEQYVAERAGGNPFFVEELLHALQETGGIEERSGEAQLVPGAAEHLPSTLTGILLARLDRLESQVKQVAQVGSVIGRSFAVKLVAKVMEREQAALELPLVALQEAEIAFPGRGSDPEYVFKHVTMREVAYKTLVSRKRRALHLQTARAIAALYPGEEYAEMIAYHYARTEAPEAVEWLERAGDRAAAAYSTNAAIASYEEARKRVEVANGERTDQARLQEKLGRVLQQAGRYDEAIPVLGAAIEGYRQGRELEGAGRATSLLGFVHRRRGTPEDGIAAVQPMLELLQRNGPSPALAALQVTLTHLYHLTGRYQDMLAAAERGSAIAQAIGDDQLRGEAEMRRGTALSQLHQLEVGQQVLERALPLVEASGDLFTLWSTLNNLGVAFWRLGRMDKASRCLSRALAVAERIDNPGTICFALGCLGETHTVVGDWGAARAHLERGVTLARTLGAIPDAATALWYLGVLELWEGNLEEAQSLFSETLRIAEGAGDRQAKETAQARLAELDMLEGRPEATIDRLEALVEAEDAELAEIVPPLVRAYLALQSEEHLERATETARQSVSRAQGQPYFLAHALWIQGMVLRQREKLQEAEASLTEGLELTRSMPFPYGEARLHHELGLVARDAGDGAEARRQLEQALAIFQRLGARSDVQRTEEAIAALAGT